MRFFNTAGPIDPNKHYYVPHRLNEHLIKNLINENKYFILHAPRQSGKTTAIRLFMQQLNDIHVHKAFYINVEAAQVARNNVSEGLRTILNRFKAGIAYQFGSQENMVLEYLQREGNLPIISGNALYEFLQFWSQCSDKPLILFIDEIDSLVGDTLISVLRQLRDGYANRPDGFPQSVCLIGVRDVRDYRIWSEVNNNMVLGGSAFNIKAESLVLHNFSLDQVRDLYGQHTQETGQQFTHEAIEYAFYLTQGQPWLVNALAYQACFRDVIDRNQTITKEIIDNAKETLIARCDTHIDVLIDRLKEPRVRNIIDVILSGGGGESDFPTDDLQYVRDLGLITLKGIEIANPIYKEIIPRSLAYTKQESIQDKASWYQRADGSLDMYKLLHAFTQFYRENSGVWLKKFDYSEAGPHLLLMAFLQRIINGGGRINREYALGSKRLDLFIEWPYENKKKLQRIVIELKVKDKHRTAPLTDGLRQTVEYMDINNATEGHLVIFDRDEDKSWDTKIFTQEHVVGKNTITVWGM